MATTKLTEKGEAFIRSKVNGSNKSYLQGTATAVLPYCYPLTQTSKVWTSNPLINGGIDYPNGIRTNDQLATALIKWYNKYADDEHFSMDANILAAQGYEESALKIWNYAINSSASGISQFVARTFYESIIKNKRGNFTDTEIIALTTNMSGYTYQSGVTPPINPFVVDNKLGRYNRPILHQNIIDNPEIMIKAQAEYMKWISTRCNSVASCTLFGYSRGPYLAYNNDSYNDWINAAITKIKSGYEKEGITYVYRIFKNLYTNFGYSELNITDLAAKNFDSFNSTLS